MPQYGNIACYYQKAISVFFNTNIVDDFNLKMLDELWSLYEQFFLRLVSFEKGVSEYFGNFHNNIALAEIAQRAYLP